MGHLSCFLREGRSERRRHNSEKPYCVLLKLDQGVKYKVEIRWGRVWSLGGLHMRGGPEERQIPRYGLKMICRTGRTETR